MKSNDDDIIQVILMWGSLLGLLFIISVIGALCAIVRGIAMLFGYNL